MGSENANVTDQPVLDVRDLIVEFADRGVAFRAVEGLSVRLFAGRTLALVGESGCGKTASALAVMRLLPPNGRIVSGTIRFRDPAADEGNAIDLSTADEGVMETIRGRRISIVLQDALSALNPVLTAGRQVAEMFEVHQGMARREAWLAAVEALERVGIPSAAQRGRSYPHQLSGGMRQRVMIAMAVACRPALLIADEPTTALDTTVQAQILDLLRAEQLRTGMAMLLITHDLGVVARMADEVAVMYGGKVVEYAGVDELFALPLHPYTQGLFRCLPRMDAEAGRLEVIPGTVADPRRPPPGCRFHPRCPWAVPRCQERDGGEPALRQSRPAHWVACWEVESHVAPGQAASGVVTRLASSQA